MQYVAVHDGFRSLFKMLYWKFIKDLSKNLFKSYSYDLWINDNETTLVDFKMADVCLDTSIKISIVIPIYRPELTILRSTINSVMDQVYPNWELCLSSCDLSQSCRNWLESISDPRVKIIFQDKNFGISVNSNNAIKIATGDFVGFLDHDDLLAPNALLDVVKCVLEKKCDFVYSDEDKINLKGQRFDPHFKPDFSPELLLSMNYICHFLVVRKSLGDKIGWFRSEFDGSQDHDFVLRCTQEKIKICHIPKILYHWRVTSSSVLSFSGNKPYAHKAGIKCVQDHLSKVGLARSIVMDGPEPFIYQFRNTAPDEIVSIIIPNKDQVELLDTCLKSVFSKSTYPRIEVLIVENNSVEKRTFEYYEEIQRQYVGKIKVLKWEKEFNYSAINNFAASVAVGEFLLFLNNDIEVISADWIERLLDHGQRSEIGVVGAKLYYPDNTIQHAGVIVGIGGIAGHSHKNFLKSSRGYSNRLQVTQNLSAVTGACMLIKRAHFNEVFGFDENIKVAFNDVDLCLKVLRKGYRNVWTPYAELYHHESKTRGEEDSPAKIKRYNNELNLMRNRWADFLKDGDPFYNINLTLVSEDFGIKNLKFEKAILP
jgi:GT2 family glycosyltransferase